jgi:hypothetical protein
MIDLGLGEVPWNQNLHYERERVLVQLHRPTRGRSV